MARGDNSEDDSQLMVAIKYQLQVGHLYYKRTPQNLHQGSNINSGPHVKGEETPLPTPRKPSKFAAHGLDETQSQAHQILLHVPMMTFRTASTNAPSARVR